MIDPIEQIDELRHAQQYAKNVDEWQNLEQQIETIFKLNPELKPDPAPWVR